MSTMVIKQEVQATPQLVAQLLTRWAAGNADNQFPYATGTFVELKPEICTAIGGVTDMPVLVVLSAKGTPLGMLAVHKADGDITLFYASADQVIGPFNFAPPEVPSSET